MKITFHYYVMKYYQTQWTDNRMPDKRGTDNQGSTIPLYIWEQRVTLGSQSHLTESNTYVTA